MPWMRVDENAMDHPKFVALSANAWRLWCEGQSYCQKHLTDGRISQRVLRGFRYYSPASFKMLIVPLVHDKGPLWHVLEDGSVQVHDYLDWNDSRETVTKARDEAKDRRRRWADRNASKDASATASMNASKDASVLSGVTCSTGKALALERGVGETALTIARGAGAGVMAGTLPRDHRRHAFCGRKCVPEFLHGEFVNAIGGPDPEAATRRFYADVMAAIPDDQPIGDEPLKFWRTQFAAHFSAVGSKSKLTAALEKAGNW